MIDTPTHKNIADFKQRYQGVMGWLNPEKPDSKCAVYVSSVTNSKVAFRDEKNNEYYANVNTGVQFEFLPTQRAWYNTKKSVFLVQRIPARQWKRGVCPDNTRIGELSDGHLSDHPVSIDWRAAAFDVMTKAVAYDVAVADFLAKGRSSVALSRHFAITNNVIYFLNLQAGTIAANVITLAKGLEIVRQELTDLINRNNYPFKVAV